MGNSLTKKKPVSYFHERVALLILDKTAAESAFLFMRSKSWSEQNTRKNSKLALLIKLCCYFTFFQSPTAKLDRPPAQNPCWRVFLYQLKLFFLHAIATKQFTSKHTVKLSAISFHKYALDKKLNCAWSENIILRSSCVSQNMADEVNNDNKVDERKIVAEFCRLLEKSRNLFNSLRYLVKQRYYLCTLLSNLLQIKRAVARWIVCRIIEDKKHTRHISR